MPSIRESLRRPHAGTRIPVDTATKQGFATKPVEILGSYSPNALDVMLKDVDIACLTGTVHVLKTEYPCHVIVQAATIQILDSSDQP